MSEEMSTDKLVSVYLKIRDAKAALDETYKTQMAELQEQLDTVGDKLLAICNDNNVETMRTTLGTVSRRVRERYWCTDWQSMHDFILTNAAPFLLEQRVHQQNMKQFLEENPDQHPPGLQADRKYVVQVRRPTKK